MTSRAGFALDLLKRKGTVTNAYIAEYYPTKAYTFRNAIAEAKKLLPQGWIIKADISGATWEKHSYTLVQISIPAKQCVFDDLGRE